MASSNVPVRVPERPAPAAPRPSVWRQDRKPTRFIIKIGGAVPC